MVVPSALSHALRVGLVSASMTVEVAGSKDSGAASLPRSAPGTGGGLEKSPVAMRGSMAGAGSEASAGSSWRGLGFASAPAGVTTRA